jgi:CRP-like cAMP-binding protein
MSTKGEPSPNWRGGALQSTAKVENQDTRNQAAAPDVPLFLGGIPMLFSGIPASEYATIFAGARRKEFGRGQVLYSEGESVRQVMLVTSGMAKINKLGMGGTEVILRLGVPGEFLGVDALLAARGHCTTAQAFRSCRVLAWDAPAFKAMTERFPVVHQNMLRILSGYVLELEERFREVATERVGPRVARQLLRLALRIGRPIDGAVEVGLPREELAQMTGTTLFTVSRLLSAWEDCGLVKPRREAVTICDVQALRAIAEDGEMDCLSCPSPGHQNRLEGCQSPDKRTSERLPNHLCERKDSRSSQPL